jgi:hypothetical protein
MVLRQSALPSTSLLEERLKRRVAPARDWCSCGARGTHKSSQISIPIVAESTEGSLNRISVPKGTFWPSNSMPVNRASAAGENHLFS